MWKNENETYALRIPNSGHRATHRHMHLGAVRVLHAAKGGVRVTDGWSDWTVQPSSLDPIVGPADAYRRN